MADTFTQIPIHAVFAVARRECVIAPSWRDRLHEYIAGVLRNETKKPLTVGGWHDHVHILFEMKTTTSLAAVMDVVKANSSRWVNEQGLVRGRFNWQNGYGAFAHSRSQVVRVAEYIKNQEEHHRKRTFREEYLTFLTANDVSFEEKYLFEFFD